jgi:hypothetical protein
MNGTISITLLICWICMSLVTMPVQGQNSPLPSHGVDAHQSSQQDNPVIGDSVSGSEHMDMTPSPEMPDAAAPPPSPDVSDLRGLSGSSQTNIQSPAVLGDMTNASEIQSNYVYEIELEKQAEAKYEHQKESESKASNPSEMEPPIFPTLVTAPNLSNAPSGEINTNQP